MEGAEAMESRDETASSHSSWKTPMKLAFPTPPTAPASDPKEVSYPFNNRPRCLRLASSMSPARTGGEGAEGG